MCCITFKRTHYWVRTVCLIIALVFPFLTQAQEEPPTAVVKPFTIGVSVAPGMSYRSLAANSDVNGADRFINIRNEQEELRFSYFASIDVGYNFKPWLSLYSGVEYANLGYQTVKNKLTYGDMIDPRYGFIYGSEDELPTHSRIIYNFHYLSIPVMVRFTIGKNRLKFMIGLGILTDFLVEASSTRVLFYSDRLNHYETASDNDNDFNVVNVSPKVQLGLVYAINSVMNVSMVPEFRYGVLQIIDTPITGYLYGGGIRLQYEYRF